MPRKKGEQEICFENINSDSKTAIFFESAKRLKKTISNLNTVLGPKRKISICREMTKLHEEIIRGSLKDVIDNI